MVSLEIIIIIYFQNKNKDTQRNKDIKITINNNNYIQHNLFNNNNINMERIYNVNNHPFDFQNNNNNIIYNIINYFKDKNCWIVIDPFNIISKNSFTSYELYQHLSNLSNLKGYKIKNTKLNINNLTGDIMFNYLIKYYENAIKNSQIQNIIQNIKLSEIPDFPSNDMNINMNLNQPNITNMNSGF